MLTRKEYIILNKYLKNIILVRTESKISNDYMVAIRSTELSDEEINEIKRLILRTDKSNNMVILPKEVNEWIIQYRDNSFKRNISLIALVFSMVSIVLAIIF